ncbi:MAG: class I SAM-dependent methyltransferase [Candidatus Coproplasma sp.]
MIDNKASLTSLMSAFARAYHTENAKSPVFSDSVAKRLFNDEEYKAMCGYVVGGLDFFAPDKKGEFESGEETLKYLVNTQLAPTPVARAKYCEDALKTAVMTGTCQYVILGAGLDTFALREGEFLNKYSVFEVDHPVTQSDKRARIERAGLTLPNNLHFVPVDFTKDNLKERLLAAGFDPNKKTFFSWLGVSYYLTVEQIINTLKSIASISAEGSTVVFDYADENLFSSNVRRVQNMLAMAQAGGEGMKSGFSYQQLEKLLEERSFLIYELMTEQDIQSTYFEGRNNNEMSAFEHINYVTAVYKRY